LEIFGVHRSVNVSVKKKYTALKSLQLHIWVFDLVSISSEIGLGLGPSQIKIFLIIFHHFLRIFPIAIKFRVALMMYFGSSATRKSSLASNIQISFPFSSKIRNYLFRMQTHFSHVIIRTSAERSPWFLCPKPLGICSIIS
jgi:hypothetical protein